MRSFCIVVDVKDTAHCYRVLISTCGESTVANSTVSRFETGLGATESLGGISWESSTILSAPVRSQSLCAVRCENCGLITTKVNEELSTLCTVRVLDQNLGHKAW